MDRKNGMGACPCLLGAVLLGFALTHAAAEGAREKPAPASGAPETVTISWAPYAAQPVDDKGEVLKLYEAKYGIKVDPVYLESAKYEELLNLRIASGKIPDVIYLGGIDRMYTYYGQGVLASMKEDFFRQNADGISRFIDGTDPAAWGLMKVGGDVVGLPQINKIVWRRVPVIRTDWLENVGIGKIPETIAEAEKAFYAFRGDDPDRNGKKDTYALSRTGIETVFAAYGALPLPVDQFMWHERDGKLVYSGVVPEMKEALALLAKWHKDGVIDPEFITGENKGGYWALSHDFSNGRIGFSTSGRDYHWFKAGEVKGQAVGQNAELVLGIDPKARFDIITPFTGPAGKGGGFIQPLSYIRYGFGVQLKDNPVKLARVLQVIDAITTDDLDNYVTSESGIKGVHWEYTADGTVKQLQMPDWRERQSKLGAYLRTIVNPDFEYRLQSTLSSWRDHKYGAWDRKKLGYTNALAVGLASQGRYKADLDALLEEAYIQIITGEKPLSYFDTFTREWNDRGGRKLTDEANAWYASVNKK